MAEHITPEIAQLARRVNRHADDPWLECDGGCWIRLEAVVAAAIRDYLNRLNDAAPTAYSYRRTSAPRSRCGTARRAPAAASSTRNHARVGLATGARALSRSFRGSQR